MSEASPADSKAMLRRAMIERRRTAHAAGAAAAQAVARHVMDLNIKGKNIAGYWPLGEELDCRLALESLTAAGVLVGLPVVAGQGQVLIFRAWKPGDTLDQGPFGTMHPNARAPIVCPQVLLIPLIAFDRRGNRLGYGAGYYDRTVAGLRAHGKVLAVGLAYDVQCVDAVPTDVHDQRLDAVITPSGTTWF